MKDAKPLDLNAPRFRRIALGTLNAAFVRLCKKNIPAAKHLSAAQIKEIISTFNGVLWQMAIEKRDGVEIPEQIGHMFIGTCPPKKKKNVDYKTTLAYMKVIQHRNWESDQHLAKIFFTTFGTKYRFKNHDLWGFIPTRNFKRAVSKTYPEKWKQYIQVDPHMKMAGLYRMMNDRMDREQVSKDQISTYNEFEL
jgi:hypothetical protein